MIEYRGMIVKELAAKTGISKRTLDTYVDNRAVVPNAEAAVKIAKALGTTVEYLVTGTEEKAGKRTKIDTPPPQDTQLFRKYKKIVDEIESLSPELQKIIFAMIHRAAEVSNSKTSQNHNDT